MWVIQSLREQVLLLETVLLYYKDYQHPPTTLLHTVLIMQVHPPTTHCPHHAGTVDCSALATENCLTANHNNILLHVHKIAYLYLYRLIKISGCGLVVRVVAL